MIKTSAIVVRDLTVISPEGHRILESLSCDVRSGEITIFMGGSGAGKSVFMKVLSGLIRDGKDGWSVKGSVEFPGNGSGRRPESISYIFQEYALFEDMTLEENLKIAMDHSPNSPGAEGMKFINDSIDALLLRDVPRNVPVVYLSGGQKQRAAIARALVYNPDILIFDEPNSGLDAKSAASLAKLITDIRGHFNKTVLIILHHTRNFTEIADALYVIDPLSKRLVEVRDFSDDSLAEKIVSGEAHDPARLRKKPVLSRLNGYADLIGHAALDFVFSVIAYLVVPRYRRPRWGFRYLWYYQRLAGIFSVSNILYMIISGVIVGFVATYFVFELLPYRKIMEPLLGDQLLRAVGFILYRVAIPVIACILVAAKGGAIIAADIATRRYNRQLDAMETLGIPYRQYLLTGILLTFVIHTPILTAVVGFEASRLTSLLVLKWIKPETSYYIWNQWFHYSLGEGFPFYRGWGYVAAKTALSGLMVGYIAWNYGTREKKSIEDVNASITGTIVASTVAVLLVHFLFAFIEFKKSGH